jgi:hypothetical protein
MPITLPDAGDLPASLGSYARMLLRLANRRRTHSDRVWRYICQDNRIRGDSAAVANAKRSRLAEHLGTTADVYVVFDDDADRRTIGPVMTATDYNLVIDVATVTDLDAWVNQDAPAVMMQGGPTANRHLSGQDAVKEDI